MSCSEPSDGAQICIYSLFSKVYAFNNSHLPPVIIAGRQMRKPRHRVIKGMQLFVIVQVQVLVNPSETGFYMKGNLMELQV